MQIYFKNASNLSHLSGKFQPRSGYQLWKDFYISTLRCLVIYISIIAFKKAFDMYFEGSPPPPPLEPLKKPREKKDGRNTDGQEGTGKSWKGGKNGQQKKKKHF